MPVRSACIIGNNVISRSSVAGRKTAARMGCGHSKINIYPRKSKTKQSSSKKSVTPEKAESEEEDGIENEPEYNKENLEDCDAKKTIKIKPFGGPLLAQTEISTSQQDFFKMLDEKIENGPDYNSESENEKMAERMRLRDLLKEWETASTTSGSQSGTPKRSPARRGPSRKGEAVVPQGLEGTRLVNDGKGYIVQVSQNVIHQSYGLPPPHQDPPPPLQPPPLPPVQQIIYRQATYTNPNYVIPGSTNVQLAPCPPTAAYPTALQYQAIVPMYSNQPSNSPPVPVAKQYLNYNHYGANMVKTYSGGTGVYGSPKHQYHHQAGGMGYEQQVSYSPNVGLRMYSSGVKDGVPLYSNGELTSQQHRSTQPMGHYQQYKGLQIQHSSQSGPYEQSPRNYHVIPPPPPPGSTPLAIAKGSDVMVQKHYEMA
ncbi:uncharacterized protein LOC115886952 [Sitophilus oryzae]|uniref:Uncharacterized protein LOC115886952 n=1 Tax=Sitophilus oryzae TaxID=7048 RepID=A0A6J2YFE0_SITOR|nr:uncharacterized protein LOC115886952 [Sitophilus oryzae]